MKPARMGSVPLVAMLGVIVAGSLSACRPDSPAPTQVGEPSLSMSYLSRAGAVQPIDLPDLDIDQPTSPPAFETNALELVSAIEKADGFAWVGFKSAVAPHQRSDRRVVPHPFKRGQTVTRGRRAALTAEAARRGLARLEARGGQIVTYYEQFGFAEARIDPAAAPTILADSTVDWIEPVAGVARQTMRWSGVTTAAQSSQTTPWGITMIRAPLVWPTTQGYGVKLLVIDGTVHAAHPDLPLGVTCRSPCFDDGSGHGTGVLGTVAANNNTFGTVGVAHGIAPSQIYSKSICAYDALGSGGGDLKFPGVTGSYVCDKQQLATELNWAAANLTPRGIVNMSLGWSSVNISFGLATAAATAWINGLLLVAGAGNLPSTDPPAGGVLYPAGYSHVIGVSGVAQDSNRAVTSVCETGFGSNYGTHVELAAPFETWAAHPPTANDPAEYRNGCGSSIASPYVAGVAALVWSYYPTWSNQRLREHLIATAIDRTPTGWDQNTGYGIVQASLADVFGPPLLTGTTTGNPKKPRLTWNAVPAASGYQIYRKVTPFSPNWELWTSTTGTSYTDVATQVTSLYGYDTIPAGTSVSYYVVAVSLNGLTSVLYSRYASYVASGTPPY